MLTIKRRRPSSIKTVLPPHKAADVQKTVDAIIGAVNPSKALAAIRPTKAFIKARINGSTNAEAKALAGISPSTRPKDLFDNPVSQLILEEILSQEDEFSDPGIVKRLKEMWSCKESVYIPVGEHVIHKRKPNWDVRKFAFTNVLELRGYKRKKDEGDNAPQATAIHFHVTPVPGQGQVPIDVEAESEK